MISAMLLTGLLLGPVLASCASAPAGPSLAAPLAPQPAGPVELTELRVRDLEGGAALELVADGSLVWTQYRDDDGNLVVELPNTEVAATVPRRPVTGGLLSTVEVRSEQSGGRPLTRLVIGTAAPSEHSLIDDGGVLKLAFVAVPEGVARAALAAPTRPLAAATPGSRASRIQEPDVSPAAPRPIVAGTPEAPVVSEPAGGLAATRLDGVELVDADIPAIRIRGNGEFEYTSFVLENPARFVLDLEGVVNQSSRSAVEVSAGVVERVRLAQFRSQPDPVSRVVIDLRSAVLPIVARSEHGLLLQFGHAIAAQASLAAAVEPRGAAPEAAGDDAPASTVATASADPVATEAEPPPVTSDRARLEVAADDAPVASGSQQAVAAPQPTPGELVASTMPPVAPPPAPEQTGAPLETGASVGAGTPLEALPESTRPRILVSDARQEAPEPPLRIEMVSDRERPAAPEPSDVSLFEAQEVRIEPRAEPEAEQAPSFGIQDLSIERRYFGDPVTLSLKDADITEVLRTFAREFDLNIVIQPGVSGPVTVELDAVPWDQALESILKVNGLGMELEGSILRIAPVDRLQQEAENEQRLAMARSLAVPLTTIMKRVSYANAQELATILTTGLRSGGGFGGSFNQLNQSGILSQRGSVSVDIRTNTLIIRELPEYLDTVIQIIQNLDTPTQQVMIEARIIETTRNFSRSLGIDWSFSGVADAPNGNTTGLQFPNNVESDGGVQLLTGGANGFFNLGLGNVLNTFQLDVALQAAEADGLINVISAPKISTLDNVSAEIQTGLQIPIQTVANNTVSVQFVNATLRLNVTPQVTAEGTIQMDIQIQKREPQLAFAVVGATNAPIATREARTRVIVRDGGTAVIGGIYTVSTNQNQDKVPGLANIPVLGHLFKNRNRSNQNEELLIFITPRVIQL
ncbi:MAG TPA: type IV pilus secretin PilQ [Thermoanaerobaculia bacterium]|nr:type IV pilus secretin PilQ [Thermoanaerobaculia bacterium]